MPLAKFNCPKCNATLKPAKPVPEGKTVKCPKCQEMFKAGAAPAEQSAAKPEEEEGPGTYGVVKDEEEEKKKAQAEERKKRKEQKKKRKAKGEDEEQSEEEEDEPEEEEEDILEQYMATVKSKDPRGPAQSAIVSPANWLLRTAIVGFFGWVFYFAVFMIPIIFPTYEKASDTAKAAAAPAASGGDDKAKQKVKKFKVTKDIIDELKKEDKYSSATLATLDESFKDKDYTYEDFLKKLKDKKIDTDDQRRLKKYVEHDLKMDAYVHWWSAETILDEDTAAWSVPIFIVALLLGLAQGAVVATAAFRMQSLESYQFSTIACIIAMVPLITFPFFVLITAAMDLFDVALDAGWADMTWCFGLIVFLVGPAIGGFALKTLMDPKVKAGFEYKSD